ncbi:hypothetical protein PBAL39_06266 [Pedobacter sp. BAL39]|uniref:DUF6266 family protein n=1 Tax=Pedobacter sp. BAL39 TaxID=391596 RepID=UPI0001559855|nr:DUF6266 family protein [Pedobacter sp. BAL39]EDM35761.1 hypothetical protein PBAL39_06266 [Pedobacter sp. BAL39]
MATYTDGFLGPFKGKLGPAHGSSWKGKPVIKGAYKKRTLNITQKEKNNRIKFAKAHRWLQPITEFVRAGFQGYSPTTEGFNAAKSLLYHAFEGEGENLVVNPAYVLVSYGTMSLPEDISVMQLNDREVKFCWNPSNDGTGDQQDQVMVLAYNADKRKSSYQLTGDFRKTGETTLKLPLNKGDYHLYIAFVSPNRKSRSNSKYLGIITV